MTTQDTKKCKKHGVVHRNGGYPSCPTPNKDPMVEKESKTLGHILFNADTEGDAIAIAEHRLLRFKEEVEGEKHESDVMKLAGWLLEQEEFRINADMNIDQARKILSK